MANILFIVSEEFGQVYIFMHFLNFFFTFLVRKELGKRKKKVAAGKLARNMESQEAKKIK